MPNIAKNGYFYMFLMWLSIEEIDNRKIIKKEFIRFIDINNSISKNNENNDYFSIIINKSYKIIEDSESNREINLIKTNLLSSHLNKDKSAT